MTHAIEGQELASCLRGWSHEPAPLYLALAGAIQRAIERGDVPAATRLPAERSLAAALVVSRGTVMAAYEQLRALGVLESRQGSGTWVSHGLGRPLTVLNGADDAGANSRRLANRLVAPPERTIDLAVAAATDVDHLGPDILRLPADAPLGQPSPGHGYQPMGLPLLRERICAYHARDGVPTSVDNVVVTAGAQQALSLVADLVVRPGDSVVVESPTYPGALDVFARAGARVVTVSADAGPTALHEAVTRTGARLVYVMPACHNPTGQVADPARQRALAELAERTGTYVVADNALADVVFAADRPRPLAACTRADNLITVGSVDKVGWGGLRTGWIRAAAPLVDQLGRLKAAHDFGSSTPSQLIACTVLERLDEVSAALLSRLREAAAVLTDELGRRLPEWTWTPPAGGFALWVRLPFGDADGFAQVAIRHGVDFTPGSAHTPGDELRDHLRLTYARPPDTLRAAAARLAAAWGDYAAAPASRGAAPPQSRAAAPASRGAAPPQSRTAGPRAEARPRAYAPTGGPTMTDGAPCRPPRT